ncbi:transketolase C-terminal domain-containing protein [Nitrosopumilus sp. b2]|uniref:transketolase family protein n=1 Tax=Nitrosopumilus sp. b2 TaxID=2109908 RepID=UPI0015F47FF3|nr:transketolase C-terminal domain-containing protein [Nitrosopumilus sp. b2]KAF6245762.1 1-deoxy-D-xylulose-5-phosphate synthase [Nitrosopumilus sp. b2]
MRTAFVNTLKELARKDERVFLVTADMGFSVFEDFREEFPDRFLNTGIAEQNTIGIAAGLAMSGKIVYVYSIIPFVTMRCFEQIRLDLAYNNTNVKLVGVGAGFTYGSMGSSHHSIEDISIMRSIPNMTVLCPGDPFETEELIKRSYEIPGPAYIRLGKNGEPIIHENRNKIEIGKPITITEGNDLILITTSNTLELGKSWVDEWKKEGIKVNLISMPTIKPIDQKEIRKIIDRDIPIITLEEHSIIGGLGSTIAEIIAEYGKKVKFKRMGINDEFSHHVGTAEFQRKKLNILQKPNDRWFLK